jgi:hypothetical protein
MHFGGVLAWMCDLLSDRFVVTSSWWWPLLRLYRRLGYVETGRSSAGCYELIHLRKTLRQYG